MSQEDFLQKLQECADKIKKSHVPDKKCYCCQQLFPTILSCEGCFKAKYCSKVCQNKDWSTHKLICKLIQPLRGKPGYNDRLKLTDYMQSVLYTHGKRYLKKSQRGALAFSIYPMAKKEYVEKLIENTKTSAACVVDPLGQFVMHYFCIPLSALKFHYLKDCFDVNFIKFCENPLVHKKHFIPVLEFKFTPDEKGRSEVSSFSYCILHEHHQDFTDESQ